MGLYLSHNNTEEKFCLICWNSIDNNRWTKCLSCNIILSMLFVRKHIEEKEDIANVLIVKK